MSNAPRHRQMTSTATKSFFPRPVGAGPAPGGVVGTRPASLPPTRAAHHAVRSRGAFLAGRGERGLVRCLVSLLLVALTAVSLVAVAPRVIDAAVVVSNPALELVAAASRLPAPPPATKQP
jgi:hypothetical protein